MAKKTAKCSKCGAEGSGVLFLIGSPYGFGTYCTECEENMEGDKK